MSSGMAGKTCVETGHATKVPYRLDPNQPDFKLEDCKNRAERRAFKRLKAKQKAINNQED